MYVLTLHQPYASLVMAAIKRYETRSWAIPRPALGQRIGIHAAASVPSYVRNVLTSRYGDELRVGCAALPGGWDPGDKFLGLPAGVILGTVTAAKSLPMVSTGDRPPFDHDGQDRVFVTNHPMWGLQLDRTAPTGPPVSLNSEIPYGHWEAGRWAWELLEPVPTTEQCPTCGGSGTAPSGPDSLGGVDEIVWDSHVTFYCPTCGHAGQCGPIIVRGKQRLWGWDPWAA